MQTIFFFGLLPNHFLADEIESGRDLKSNCAIVLNCYSLLTNH